VAIDEVVDQQVLRQSKQRQHWRYDTYILWRYDIGCIYKLGRSKVGLGKLGLGKLGFGKVGRWGGKLGRGTTSKSA